jgi:formate hydrogenlyase subunit 3/multisubunit Na+/H+ antiporter MnhD subunit
MNNCGNRQVFSACLDCIVSALYDICHPGGTAALYPQIAAGRTVSYELFSLLPNLSLTFRVDILGFCLLLLSSFVWLW